MTTQTTSEQQAAIRRQVSQAYACQGRQNEQHQRILDHLPLVRHIAQKVASHVLRSAEDIEDLISAGTLGLVRAAQAYDPSHNADFRTYAYIRIRGTILDELRARSFAPSTALKRIRQVQQVYQRCLARTGKPPADEDFAREAGCSLEQLYEILREAHRVRLLSIQELGDGDSPGPGFLPQDHDPGPDAQVERKEAVGLLTEAIKQLPARDRQVVLLYYERDLTMKEIAQVLEVTESRVCQLHASAVFKLSMKLKGRP